MEGTKGKNTGSRLEYSLYDKSQIAFRDSICKTNFCVSKLISLLASGLVANKVTRRVNACIGIKVPRRLR